MKDEDAYGELQLAALEGRGSIGVIERDDGLFEPTDVELHFRPFRRWPRTERKAMRFVRGRVLDVGCGAGRVCLHLQQRGQDVVGIDSSPGAVEVCRRRGVRDVRVLSLDQVDASLGTFDTVVMYGNNLCSHPATNWQRSSRARAGDSHTPSTTAVPTQPSSRRASGTSACELAASRIASRVCT